MKTLEKQGYRLTGKHSATKICNWTRESIRDKGVCYKQEFYGIQSHKCCQMTPCLTCNNSCTFLLEIYKKLNRNQIRTSYRHSRTNYQQLYRTTKTIINRI